MLETPVFFSDPSWPALLSYSRVGSVQAKATAYGRSMTQAQTPSLGLFPLPPNAVPETPKHGAGKFLRKEGRLASRDA